MSAVRVFQILALVYISWRANQVCCEDTDFYVVNYNGTIINRDTFVFNNTAVILFIQCLCLTNTTVCSTKDIPSGPIPPPTPCNFIDVDSGGINFTRSSKIFTHCSRENSKTFITFLHKAPCPFPCLVISFPRIDITLPKTDFINASQQCKHVESSLTATTTYVTTATPTTPTSTTTTTSTSSTPSSISTATTTTSTPSPTTAPSNADGGSNLIVILTCSILGLLVVIVITCLVVIIRRKKAKKLLLANSERQNPLVYRSDQDDLSDAYSHLSHGYQNNGDVHYYERMQHSSFANDVQSGITSPGAYASLDYLLPNQAVASKQKRGHSEEMNSLQSDIVESGTYIEIIDDALCNQGKTPEYLGLYDQPQTTNGNTYSASYAAAVSAQGTNVGNDHHYLSLKLSDSDSLYIDAHSVRETEPDKH